MNFKNIIVLFIFLLIVIYSCNDKPSPYISERIIDINPLESLDELKLSEIADSVYCIKLQSEGCMMGRIHSIYIKNEYIYIWDISQQILFVFDKNGKFIKKLDKRGRGPDEYFHIGGVFIDENEEYVELMDMGGKKNEMIKYSLENFNLLDKKSFPKIIPSSSKKIGKTYYFATQQIENIINKKPTNSGLLIVEDYKIVETLFDKNIVTDGYGFSPNIESLIINDEGRLFASVVFDNTFYEIINEEAHPLITVDFGDYGADNSIGMEPIKEQIEYIKETNGKALFPVLNINNSGILAFSYYFKQDTRKRFFRKSDYRQYIRFKNVDKTFHFKKITNDLTDFPDELFISTYFFDIGHVALYDDYLVDIVLPSKYLLSNSEKTKINTKELGEISINDNPIIVLIKLKQELL